jgi:hypothetical protein
VEPLASQGFRQTPAYAVQGLGVEPEDSQSQRIHGQAAGRGHGLKAGWSRGGGRSPLDVTPFTGPVPMRAGGYHRPVSGGCLPLGCREAVAPTVTNVSRQSPGARARI